MNDLALAVPDAFYETLFARFPVDSGKEVNQMKEELARVRSGITSAGTGSGSIAPSGFEAPPTESVRWSMFERWSDMVGLTSQFCRWNNWMFRIYSYLEHRIQG
ncbi:MAG: hypothetical protein ACYC0L_06540 [Thermoleophilia bacterium]